jgi:hypothetical protein
MIQKPTIPTLRKLRQKNHELKASLGYIARLVSKKKKRTGLNLINSTEETN